MKGMSARKSALNADQEAWENNRLLTSGVVTQTSVDLDFEVTDQRVTLMVHNTKPPFLDGRVNFSTQQTIVPGKPEVGCVEAGYHHIYMYNGYFYIYHRFSDTTSDT